MQEKQLTQDYDGGNCSHISYTGVVKSNNQKVTVRQRECKRDEK